MYGSDKLLAVSSDSKFIIIRGDDYDGYLYLELVPRGKRGASIAEALDHIYCEGATWSSKIGSCSSAMFTAVSVVSLLSFVPGWFDGLINTFENMQKDIPGNQIDSYFLQVAKKVWSIRLANLSKSRKAQSDLDTLINKRAADDLFNVDVE
jgi:hypothetical protein